jgi:hypothetical protein
MGTIFALGDPWLYNEYINSRDNFRSGTNVMQWLLARVPSVPVNGNAAIKFLIGGNKRNAVK